MDWQHSPGRTNQKIQFARVQLETLHYLSSLEKNSEVSHSARIPEGLQSDLSLATCESVAQHLRAAWHALMVEVAGAYGVVLDHVDHPQALIEALACENVVSPEAARMLVLQSLPGGWVGDMLALAKGTDRLGQFVSCASESFDPDESELVEAVGRALVIDDQLAMLRGCLEALEGFVDATRITMMEW